MRYEARTHLFKINFSRRGGFMNVDLLVSDAFFGDGRRCRRTVSVIAWCGSCT